MIVTPSSHVAYLKENIFLDFLNTPSFITITCISQQISINYILKTLTKRLAGVNSTHSRI